MRAESPAWTYDPAKIDLALSTAEQLFHKWLNLPPKKSREKNREQLTAAQGAVAQGLDAITRCREALQRRNVDRAMLAFAGVESYRHQALLLMSLPDFQRGAKQRTRLAGQAPRAAQAKGKKKAQWYTELVKGVGNLKPKAKSAKEAWERVKREWPNQVPSLRRFQQIMREQGQSFP